MWRSIASSVTAAKASSLFTDHKAAAAFFWLQLFAWLGSLTLVGLTWYQQRTNPRSHAFAQPSAEYPDPNDDPFDAGEFDAEPPRTAYAAGGGYRPSGEFFEGQGEGGVFGEGVHGYEGVGEQRFEEEEEKYHPRKRDPFEDQPTGGREEWGPGGGGTDPYAQIREVSLERRAGDGLKPGAD